MIAIAVTGASILLRALLNPLISLTFFPSLTFMPALLVSAWCGGLWPGLLCTGLSASAILFFWLEPVHSFAVNDPRDLIGLALFGMIGLGVSAVNEVLHRERARLQVVQKEADDARRAREELLAVVSHDLKTPIGVIVLNAEMIARSVDEQDARMGRRVAAIRRANQGITELIRNVLDAAAIESGGLRLEPKPEDLVPLVREAIEMLAPLAEQKAIELSAELPTSAPLRCERGRILRVLSNLIGNAIKFTKQTGHVRVGIELDEDNIRIAVSDTGPGIAEEHLPHLFDRYYHGAHSQGAETGLGLYIVKEIVQAHGGRIKVDTKVGEGSTFSFSLPRTRKWN